MSVEFWSNLSELVDNIEKESFGTEINEKLRFLLKTSSPKILIEKSEEAVSNVDKLFVKMLSSQLGWESLHLSLMFCKKVCESWMNIENRLETEVITCEWITILAEHDEVRVREKCSEFITLFISRSGQLPVETINNLNTVFLEFISRDFIRREQTRIAILGHNEDISLDDTTGWGKLESSLKSYYSLILAVSQKDLFQAFSLLTDTRVSSPYPNTVTDETNGHETIEAGRLVVTLAAKHTNRYVRENTLLFIENYCKIIFQKKSQLNPDSFISTSNYTTEQKDAMQSETDCSLKSLSLINGMIEATIHGMQDDWSQMRLAGGKSCRSLLQCLLFTPKLPFSTSIPSSPDEKVESEVGFLQRWDKGVLEPYWASLLPRLCLNRFYAAESVKWLSLDTWRDFLGPEGLGRRLLVNNIEQFVTYYVEMADSANHMVVEASCHAMAEVMSRIDAQMVSPHICKMLESLRQSIDDDRWPVRDSACIASGVLFRHFSGDEEVARHFPHFVFLWQKHLRDCIWSVRENAALAFKDAIESSNRVVSNEAIQVAVAYIRDNLSHLKEIEEKKLKGENGKILKNFLPEAMLNKSITAKSIQTSSPPIDLAATQTQVSESNDKSKLKRGWGCCLDCVKLRQALPWEVTHGAVYLWREVLSVDQGFNSEDKIKWVDTVIQLLELENCEYEDKFKSAVYKEIPLILEFSGYSRNKAISIKNSLTSNDKNETNRTIEPADNQQNKAWNRLFSIISRDIGENGADNENGSVTRVSYKDKSSGKPFKRAIENAASECLTQLSQKFLEVMEEIQTDVNQKDINKSSDKDLLLDYLTSHFSSSVVQSILSNRY